MARQIGSVLGVAALIAILSNTHPADPIAMYRHGIELILGFFLASAIVTALVLWRRTPTASAQRPSTSDSANGLVGAGAH